MTDKKHALVPITKNGIFIKDFVDLINTTTIKKQKEM